MKAAGTEDDVVSLGDHEGLQPLATEAARAAVLKAALPAMARLKAGKDVTWRKKRLARALAAIAPDDRYWIELFASGLTGEDGIGAAEAQAVAFTGAWAVAEDELARAFRLVSISGGHPYAGEVLRGLMDAAPEFGDRMMKGQVDSDQVVLRVMLAHLFRRQGVSTMQMFVVDGAARLLPKAMKRSVGELARDCLERFDEVEVPSGTWGYVVVLNALKGRSGYFLPAPDAASRKTLAEMKQKLRGVMGPGIGEDEVLGHIAAAAISGYMLRNQLGSFALVMSAVFEEKGVRCAGIYLRDEPGGAHTEWFDIPTSDPEEARQMISSLPQVRMHDDFRAFSEALATMSETEGFTKQ